MTKLWPLVRGNARWLLVAAALLLGWLALSGLTGGGGASTSASEEERRVARVLSRIEGAGRVEVALFSDAAQTDAYGVSRATRPSGAVVVAEGADDLQVRLRLIRAVRTLLSLPESAVDVFVMEAVE